MADEAVGKLLERWVAGDAAAAEEICRLYYDRAWRFAMSLTGRETEADDIAQQALAAGLQGIKGGARPDRFTQWIMAIARNSLLKEHIHKRRERPGRNPDAASDMTGVVTGAMSSELNGLLRAAVDRLNDRDRRIVRLRFEQKLDRVEAAEKLGVSPQVLDRMLASIFRRLRAALSRHFTTLAMPLALGVRGRLRLLDVQRLRPAFRRAFELRHLEGLARDAAARQLRVPPETVDARLQHAYHELGCGPDDDFAAVQREYRRRHGRL